MEYVVWGARATRTFRVLWMLEELGIAYTHKPVKPGDPALAELWPSAKVPVLCVDGTVLPDSVAILTWLADRHGRFTAPAGTLERARQDAWTLRILDEIEAPLWTAAKHSFVLPEAERVPEVKATCRAEHARALTRISEEMAGPFVMGGEMSVPDFVLTHCGGWAENARFPPAPDAHAAYLARMRARPAFARAAAL